jgi:hypothetical protein
MANRYPLFPKEFTVLRGLWLAIEEAAIVIREKANEAWRREHIYKDWSDEDPR